MSSAYHLEAKTTICIKIGRVSLPFSVSLHKTIIGDFFFSTHSIKPSFSSSFRRIERTVGVRPRMDSSSRLATNFANADISNNQNCPFLSQHSQARPNWTVNKLYLWLNHYLFVIDTIIWFLFLTFDGLQLTILLLPYIFKNYTLYSIFHG